MGETLKATMASTLYSTLVVTCAIFLELRRFIETQHVKITVIFAFSLVLATQIIIDRNKEEFKDDFPTWEAVVLCFLHYILFFMPVFHILADKYISTK